MKSLPLAFRNERAIVRVDLSKIEAGRAAALAGADLLRRVIAERGSARIIVATGNSQQEMVATLAQQPGIAWSQIDVFHMDEYVNLDESHPASFRLWVKTRLVDRVHPRKAHFLRGDAQDPLEECRRYGELIRVAPIDVCFLGIGENGHIAFNDPHVADFNDPQTVKLVELDERCRQQQVGEGHFPNLAAVPQKALTLTCPTLMSARNLVCCVPEMRKAEAVSNSLHGPISTACPGSILRTHSGASIFLDNESASLLPEVK